MDSPEKQRQIRLIAIALGLGTFFLYCSVLGHGFIVLDDRVYVKTNPHVWTGLTWRNVCWAFTTSHLGNWHPLTWMSHMLDCQIFGLEHPGGHHLVSLLFHIASAILLFIVMERMTGRMWRSAAVAALFAWHPLRVESVAWIAERKDVLCAFFWMLTMLEYVRYAQDLKAGAPSARKHYGFALLWFALGLMCKSMLVTLPFVLLLIDYWPLRRSAECGMRNAESEKPSSAGASWRKLVIEKLPFFTLALASCIITFISQKKGGAVSDLVIVPFSLRFENVMLSYGRYLAKMVWPTKLAIFYPLLKDPFWKSTLIYPFWMWISSLVVVVLISILAIVLVRRCAWFSVGWFWFLGTLVPVIGFVQVGRQSMADRYSYLPSIGIAIAVVWAGGELIARMPKLRTLGCLVGGVVIALFALATPWQLHFWKNDATLFGHTVEVTPLNTVSLDDLALGLEEKGQYVEAFSKYEQSLALDPEFAPTLYSMGHNCALREDFAEAVKYYDRALGFEDLATTRYNLGNALVSLNKLSEAQEQYSRALKLEPDSPDIENNLGAVLMRQGKMDEAVMHFHNAIRWQPNFPEAHEQLAAVLERKGHLEEARFHYAEAVRLKPDFAHAHLRLGLVMAKSGEVVAAIPHFQTAIELEPTNSDAYLDLGAAYAALEKWPLASQAFETASHLKPASAEIQQRLAEAKAKAGQLPKDPNTLAPKEILNHKSE